MKRRLLIIWIVFLTCNCLFESIVAQGDQDYDLLKRELLPSQNDTSTIRLLNTIAYSYFWDFEYDSCLKYANQALLISDSLLELEKVKNNPAYLTDCKVFKARSLANIARGIKSSYTEASIKMLKKSVKLIQETGNKLEEAKIYESIGVIYDFNSQDELALKNHLLALEAYREAGNKGELALQLTNVAVTHRNLGNYGDALEYLVEALELCRVNNDSANMVEALLAIGFTYMFVEKWEDALKVQNEALTIYQNLNDSLGIARIYNDMGTTNMSAGNFDIALEQHKKALALRLNTNDYYYIYASYSYIGDIYHRLGRYQDAIESYESGLQYATLAGFKISIIYTHLNIGQAYFLHSDYEKALINFKLALKLSNEIDNGTNAAQASLNIAKIYLSQNKPLLALNWLQIAEKAAPRSALVFLEEIYESIAETYFQLGDYKKAYLNHLQHSVVKDSLILAENLDKITTLSNHMEFENRKKLQDESHIKQMEIKQSEIERQKVVKNFSLFGAFVILVLAIIYFVRFIEKNKLNTALRKTLSNLKSTQVQLVHAEKMVSLGELTAGVAHEIQNPLNFINNFSELNSELIEEIKEEWEKGNHEEVKALLDDIVINETKINQHGKRAETIVKGMLQHSRISTGEKEPTNINSLADEYLRLAYHGLRAKDKSFNAQFETEFDDSIPRINLISQDIGRVLLNLFNNAFYACAERSRSSVSSTAIASEDSNYKPQVKIITKNLEGKVEIRVLDNGNGIPSHVIDKIFQPFFTTKPAGKGTGLGLSLSFDIITKGHGGELKVETNEGEGASFIISLPLN